MKINSKGDGVRIGIRTTTPTFGRGLNLNVPIKDLVFQAPTWNLSPLAPEGGLSPEAKGLE